MTSTGLSVTVRGTQDEVVKLVALRPHKQARISTESDDLGDNRNAYESHQDHQGHVVGEAESSEVEWVVVNVDVHVESADGMATTDIF